MSKRRVVSKRSFVDPNLVGTTKPTGTTGRVGQQREYLGTVESVWTCSSCGTSGIPGGTKSCPNCKSPKGGKRENEEYQHPADSAPYLSPAQLTSMGVDVATHESDEQCPFCDAKLNPGTQVCPNCNGNIVDAARTSRKCLNCGRETNSYKCENCGSETVNHKDIVERPSFTAPARREYVDPYPEPKRRPTVNWRLVGIGLAVVAIIAVVAFLLWPRQERATVSQSSWVSTVYLEEYQYNQHSGWSIPMGGDYVSQSEQFHHYESVYSHTENQCHMETVPDGYDTVYDTDEVCTSVYSHTDETCYDDGTCDREAVYEDECHDVTTSRQVPRTRQERVCEDVRIYRDEPRYATQYVYNIWEWVSISPAVLSGTGSEVRYPTDFVIDERHRETRRAQTFSLTFSVGENSYTYIPGSLSEYLQYPWGTEWVIVRTGNTITEIKPVEAE